MITRSRALCSALLVVAAAATTRAGEPKDEFDFGDVPALKPTAATNDRASVDGTLRSELGLGVARLKDHPIAKARQSLDLRMTRTTDVVQFVLALHGEVDPSYLLDHDYDEATVATYGSNVDLRRASLSFTGPRWDVTFGRQVVNWGVGDMVSLTDLVGAKDFREPGLVDLDDLRLPLLMTRVGFGGDEHRLELVVVHETPLGLQPPPLAPMSSLPQMITHFSGVRFDALFRDKVVRYDSQRAAFDADAQGALVRWTYRGRGLDLAAYAGTLIDPIALYAAPTQESYFAPVTEVPLFHERFGVVAFTGARPVGDFVIAWEALLAIDRAYNIGNDDDPIGHLGIARTSTFGGLLALRWSGMKDTTVALEVAQTLPFEEREDWAYEIDVPTIALGVTHLALDGDLRIHLGAMSLGWDAQLGWLARAELAYRVADGLELALGAITYQPTGRPSFMAGLARADRVLLRVRWDFSLR